MRVRSLLSPLAILLVLLGAGCTGDPTARRDLVVRYDDLVTDAAAVGGEDRRGRIPCADKAWFSRPVEAGSSISLPLTLGKDPRLVITACRPESGESELVVRATAQGATLVESRMVFQGPPEWQRLEIDLSPLAGLDAEVGLSVSLPKGHRILLREAYVRHRSPAPAGWPETESERAGAEAIPRGVEARLGSPAPPPVLLISVDTLRFDVVDLLPKGPGDGESKTPSLARLAADGEVFTVHRPGASWTKPSHATLLTGYPESVHGADGNAAMPERLPRLAGRLREAGYRTAGIVFSSVWLEPKFGFDIGFDRYRTVEWDTDQIGRSVVNWIGAHRHEPFFFFFHTFGPHSDFDRLPYESRRASSDLVRKRFGMADYGCRAGLCASGFLKGLGEGKVPGEPRDPEVLEFLYRSGVEDADRHLGVFFEDLRETGVYDDLLIVVTSDHGEMLLEHGATLHGTYWEPVIRVPLIVKWPSSEGRTGRVTEIPTSAIDVAPTVLALAGVDKGDLGGVDLRRPRPDRPLFVGHPKWWAVYEDGHKGIFFASGDRRLYDLSRDPNEKEDLAESEPRILGSLEERLIAFRSWSDGARERLLLDDENTDQTYTPEERKRLRALGYLQ